jgi:hypothetical protein
MWCSSRTSTSRIFALVAGALIAACVTGCLSDPADGDLPWNKQQTWEGSPALPPGMLQQR